MTIDAAWEKIFSERPWGKYPSEDVIRFVARHFYKAPDRKQVRILDLGCGGGSQTWYMAREGFDVYSIDGSPSAIKQTQHLLADNNLTANLQVGDVAHLNYPDNYFDAVIDCMTITTNTWEDILTIHHQIKRVLKPKGKFFGIKLGADCSGAKSATSVSQNTFQDINNPFITPGIRAHLFTLDEINELLQDYENIDITRLVKYHNDDIGAQIIVSGQLK